MLRTKYTWEWSCLFDGPLQIFTGICEIISCGWWDPDFYISHIQRRVQRQVDRKGRERAARYANYDKGCHVLVTSVIPPEE